MSGSMRFGSVCSGIEAASVAWRPLGWEAAWLSEIEKFPCAVLAHHYPDVPNLGDMTALPDRIRSGEVEAPDVFCGGTPCQAFSVAGLRKSLDDARGNLSLTFCEIANAIDQVRLIQQSNPSIVFWENVPGVLNTKDNAFGCFLGALAGEDEVVATRGGRWPNAGFIAGRQRAVAWRILDAQFFGTPQRRRRVYVIASARTDIDPAQILFEPSINQTSQLEKRNYFPMLTTQGGGLSLERLRQCVFDGNGVRYLTAKERERLQGFPDNYTDVKPKGKPTPNGPRYKALGNSWAVPVVRWIGERIARAT